MTDIVSCQNLKKRYNKKVWALKGINLNIPKGLVYGLLGPNGSGKTTFLRVLMGLLQADEGDLTVFGHHPKSLPIEWRQKIGYSSSTLPLIPWLKAADLLSYNGAFYPTWDKVYVEKWINRLGLNIGKRVYSLSRGEKQKLAFLMAIGHRPELLVLDEPTEGLDPIARQEFLESLIELLHESGTTVILSSHLMNDVERVADHVAFIYQGEVSTQNTLEHLKHNTRRVNIYHQNDLPPLPFTQFKNKKQYQGLTQVLCFDWNEEKVKAWETQTGLLLENESLSLEDIFVLMHQLQEVHG